MASETARLLRLLEVSGDSETIQLITRARDAPRRVRMRAQFPQTTKRLRWSFCCAARHALADGPVSAILLGGDVPSAENVGKADRHSPGLVLASCSTPLGGVCPRGICGRFGESSSGDGRRAYARERVE